MASHGLQANKVTYNELLHAKVLAKDRRGLWGLADEMRQAGVRANSVSCSILLKSLTVQSPASDMEKVISLIDEVEEAIDEVLFSSVIEACIRIKKLDVLSDVMRRYKEKGGFVNLTAPTYGSMIKAYGQYGDVVRVRELWREMEDRGVHPTPITLGCMTEALVKNQQPDEAWELLHNQLKIEDRKSSVNTVIYSTVLKGFAFARRIDKVFSVYEEMRNKKIPCNTITCNTMLDACAKCCRMDRAPALLEDMRESSVEPDIITYSTIVKGFCVEGDVDKAISVLEDMKADDKFAPDEIMYNSILDGCAKQHRVDDALHLLEEMKTRGVVPSNYTLSILVKLLGHARRLSQAFKLVEELTQQHGFRPNVQVYTCLVQACLTNRRLERAMALHDTMVADAGCATDEKFYGVLARGCLQLRQPLKAAEVVRAAFHLQGHSLALPARRDSRPVGIEARALDEVAARLRTGGKEEQEAFASLSADLLQCRGIHLGDGHAASGSDRRRTGGSRSGGKGGGKGGK
jgi:pentatricopeptide repeat protein